MPRRTLILLSAALIGIFLLSILLLTSSTLARKAVDFRAGRPLAPRQIDRFLADKPHPLVITTVADEATAILCRNPTDFGWYLVHDDPGPWFDREENIGYNHYPSDPYALDYNPAQVPVSIIYGHTIMNHVVGITINDAHLRQTTASLMVQMADGTRRTISISDQPGAIVVLPVAGLGDGTDVHLHYAWEEVALYNEVGQLLHQLQH